ncbi:MAG TPA: beta-ketoacyl synthase N-terminal-like domain-containing protein [Labilithrix sp.]|jgi:3-oxoacyl-(acyl-carrier-protein) synthase
MTSICATGAGAIVLGDGEPSCDPTPFLRVRKSRKYMGLQDDLAVVATGRALASAGLGTSFGDRAERAGLFLAVGYIPFREEDILPVLEASTERDAFDVKRFGAGGFQRAHPLLTFRCLPNMPAYHVSVSFDVQGPYCVSYPGPAQLYAALEEACAAIAEGRVDVALVGGVAAQSNFLVRHHFARIDAPVSPGRLRDAAGMIVLESEAHARARGATVRAKLESLHVEYMPHDVLREGRPSRETVDGAAFGDELGPARLCVALAESFERGGTMKHVLDSRDGVLAESLWVLA